MFRPIRSSLQGIFIIHAVCSLVLMGLARVPLLCFRCGAAHTYGSTQVGGEWRPNNTRCKIKQLPFVLPSKFYIPSTGKGPAP